MSTYKLVSDQLITRWVKKGCKHNKSTKRLQKLAEYCKEQNY